MRVLSDHDIMFLRSKLATQANSDMVMAKDFEAFWQWWSLVFSALEIIYREWLCEAPTPVVIGFSGRKESEAALKEKPSGTFLLRFSTSHLGLLAISFVAPPPSPSASVPPPSPGSAPVGPPIQHCLVRVTEKGCELFMEPGRKRYDDLQALLEDIATLTLFYPDVPKQDVLQALRKPLPIEVEAMRQSNPASADETTVA
ncbi:transcriptional repressor [Nannochloropsis gaditana]|uniref:Transcriptional repressor n=1 Tax=Nannochloropsis gaditana TaxID=72520 RepID=W7U4B2_9STRA|nr:transcriptional repressor [Nannochloropsis gaditana]